VKLDRAVNLADDDWTVVRGKGETVGHHLAQINIGRLIAPMNDPRIADFLAQLDQINALAEDSPGFVWRLQGAYGNAMDIAYSKEDPTMNVNMSVWESLEALEAYVYRSDHVRVFRQRAKWFVKLNVPAYCLWWVPLGHIPTVAEGRERLEHYQKNGATPYAFWFSRHFPAPASEPIAV
jgi:hypothetical protein